MAAVSAAVVLLPLVPVMATTRASAKSSSHRAMAVVTTTPAARAASSSGRYRLTPGARTTTSIADQATAAGSTTPAPDPLRAQARRRRPRAGRRRSGPRPRSARSRAMARPSCPAPRRPPAGRQLVEGHGPPVEQPVARRRPRPPRGGRRRHPGRPGSAAHATARRRPGPGPVGQAPPPPAIPPLGSLGQESQGGGRLAALADALERLVLVAHQVGEARRPGPGSANRSRPMMAVSASRLEEGGQHQRHEPALGAVAAPAVRGVGRLAEGGVTAAEGAVVLR